MLATDLSPELDRLQDLTLRRALSPGAARVDTDALRALLDVGHRRSNEVLGLGVQSSGG
jgi:hypothetical protein